MEATALLLDCVTAADFEPHLGSEFAVVGSAPLRLAEATVSRLVREDGRPFSLVFEAPLEVRLDQGMRAMSHPDLGSMDLFLVPIAPTATASRYEALFN